MSQVVFLAFILYTTQPGNTWDIDLSFTGDFDSYEDCASHVNRNIYAWEGWRAALREKPRTILAADCTAPSPDSDLENGLWNAAVRYHNKIRWKDR